MNLIVATTTSALGIAADICEAAMDAVPWPFSAAGAVCDMMEIAVTIIEFAIEFVNYEMDAAQFNLGELQTHPINLAENAQMRSDANTQAVASATSGCIEEGRARRELASAPAGPPLVAGRRARWRPWGCAEFAHPHR